MKRIGALVLLLGSMIALLGFESSAVAWQTVRAHGESDGRSTHQWILDQTIALAQAAGADWVDAPTALAAVNTPDTVLRSLYNHAYDRSGMKLTVRTAQQAQRQYQVLMRSFWRFGLDRAATSITVKSFRRAGAGAAAIIVKAQRDKHKRRPSPTPTPLAPATASPTPTPLAPATASPTPTPLAPATASPTPTPLAPATASPTPTPLAPATASPTPTPLAPATASPTPTPIPSPGSSYLSVTTYGAKGNGTSDDTAAIKAALNAAAAKGGGTVFVPAGDYRVSSLSIPAGVNLVGEGMARSWLHGAVVPGSTQTLSDLKIGAEGVSLRFASGSHDSLLLRCRIVGGPPAIVFVDTAVRDVTFRGCEIVASRATVDNAVSMMEYGTPDAHYEDIVWEDCHFFGSTRMTVEILQHAATRATLGYRNISFLRCVFEPSDSQVLSYDCAPVPNMGNQILSGNSRVEGCTFKGAGANPNMGWPHHLEINGPKYMLVKDNTFYACRGAALNFNGNQHPDNNPLGWITVTGNTFDMTQGATPHPATATAMASGSGTILRNNTFKVNTGGDVILFYGPNNLVENNTVTATKNNMLVDLDGAANNVIRGNTFLATGATVRVRSGSSGSSFTNNQFVTGRTESGLFVISDGVSITRSGNTYR